MAYTFQDGNTAAASPPARAKATAPAPPPVQSTQQFEPQLFNPPKAPTSAPAGPFPSKASGAVLTPIMTALNVLAARKAKAEQQKVQVAVAQIQGQNATWDAAAKSVQQWRLAHPGEDIQTATDPEAVQLRAFVKSAWDDRVHAYSQYTMPDGSLSPREIQALQARAQAGDADAAKELHKQQSQHKKSVANAIKGFLKGEVTPETPQLILQSQLNRMQSANPFDQIPQPSSQEILAADTTRNQTELENIKQWVADHDGLPGTANAQQVAVAKRRANALSGGKAFPAPTAEEGKAAAIQKVLDGTATPEEKQIAGVKPLPGGSITVERPDGEYVIPTDENHVPKSRNPSDWIRVGPGKDSPAVAKAKEEEATWQQAVRHGEEAGLTHQQAVQQAYEALYKGAMATPDAQAQVVSNAISDAISQMKPAAAGAWFDFAYRDADGKYHLRSADPNAGPVPTTTAGEVAQYDANGLREGQRGYNSDQPAFKPGDTIYPGGLPVSRAAAVEAGFLATVRRNLAAAGMNKAQQDRVIGRELYGVGTAAPTAAKASPPPTAAGGAVSDQQVKEFLATPAGRGMTPAVARAALEAAAKGSQ